MLRLPSAHAHQCQRAAGESYKQRVDLFAGVVGGETDAKRAVRLCWGESEGREARARVLGMRGAGRAARDADAEIGEKMQHGLALDGGELQIDNMRGALARGEIEHEARLTQPVNGIIPQFTHVRQMLVQMAEAVLGGRAEGGDADGVFRARAQAAFLTAADEVRNDLFGLDQRGIDIKRAERRPLHHPGDPPQGRVGRDPFPEA